MDGRDTEQLDLRQVKRHQDRDCIVMAAVGDVLSRSRISERIISRASGRGAAGGSRVAVEPDRDLVTHRHAPCRSNRFRTALRSEDVERTRGADQPRRGPDEAVPSKEPCGRHHPLGKGRLRDWAYCRPR